MNFSDNEFKVHKQLCNNIVVGLKPIKDKLDKIVFKQHAKLKQLKEEISKQEDLGLINSLSAEVEKEKTTFVKSLAIKTSVENIISKNESRIAFIDDYFKKIGIYNDKVDKKEMRSTISEINNIELSLNETFLNPKINLDYFVFYGGQTYKISKNEFIFFDDYNKNMLEKFTDQALKFAINYHPKSIATIKTESLLNISVKKKVLKQIAYYASDKISKMSIKDIDESLGGLLNFNFGTPSSLSAYILEVENSFNVRIKNYLIDSYELSKEQVDSLVCNEKSKFLLKA